MSISERISPFLGRLLLGWFFLSQVWFRLYDWDGSIALMEMKHISFAAPILGLVLLMMVLAGLALLFGYQTRPSALLLFAFTVLEALVLHDYWTIRNSFDRASDYEMFMRDMAIAGGLLLLVGMGPGPFALDNGGKRK